MAKITKKACPERLSRGNLEHVAKLGRLELTSEEKTKFTSQMGSILEYFEKLDAVDTSRVQAIDQINDMENIAASDEVKEKRERDELLKNAPEQEDGFIKVKAVFE